MKFIPICLLLAVHTATAATTVFNSDTIIAAGDATYDGSDVVVSNCVLTVDGPHSFNSVRVAGTGVVTHTPLPHGSTAVVLNVTNESQVLISTNPVALSNANVVLESIIVQDLTGTNTYTNTVDYTVTAGPGALTSLQRTDISSIPYGGTVLVSYSYTVGTNAGLLLSVTNDFEVEPTARVDVSGRGYGGGIGQGRGTSLGSVNAGSGGGYGGYGGISSSNALGGAPYGSPFEPDQLGSGGGAGVGGLGAAGGGVMRLAIGGNLLLNGALLANGANATNSRSGGGSGGSIWVSAQLLVGTGVVSANGGAGEPIHGGGGGGGRIAIEYATNSLWAPIAAKGGAGWQRGGAGTIFTRAITPGLAHGVVTFDNGGSPGANTLLQFTNAADLVVQGNAVGVLLPGVQTVGNLVVRTNSSLITSSTNNATLQLNVTGNATIEAGGSLPLAGRGASQNSGSGVPPFVSSTVGGGASHGGTGGIGQSPGAGAPGGPIYDTTVSPTIYGSGGRSVTLFNGGAGGGAVRLTISGNLQVDGSISADGTAGAGAAGGGSGGSVWLTLGGGFSGSGSITANGGDGGLPYGGGAGGGRIAISYQSNNFVGILSAHGGNGAVPGGAGTIYTKANNLSAGNLTLDNGGLRGSLTLLDTSSLLILRITGGTIATSTLASITVTNFTIGSNSSWLEGFNATFNLNLNGSGTIAAGGNLSADGISSGSQGAGIASTSGSGGGAYGGNGGAGAGAAGGAAFGTSSQPGSSGGGRGGATIFPAPNGGGALRLTVRDLLRVDGSITANGLTTTSNNNGGGAGGSVYLTVGGLTGTGALRADGGAGHLPFGGGGGGGRLTVIYSSNLFSGTYSAKGGVGFGNGGAGTVYLNRSFDNLPTLIADNGGLRGTNTPLDLTSLLELRVLGGAYVTSSISSTITVSNLIVGSNATMVSGFGFPGLRMNVSGNATIAGLLVGAAGSSAGSGSGVTSQFGSGGGGHGGFGGRGAGAGGGIAFDSSSQPNSPGGAGGGSPPVSGGGSIQLTVAKLLTVDGAISVNGLNGPTNTGGGAGGGMLLTVGGIAGSGLISADGGAGNLPLNGGGGGGRIAVYYGSNTFSGSYSAKGGIGFANGGAGTLYLKANTNQLPVFIADNGGVIGTNTPLDQNLSSLLELRVLSGAYLTSSISSTITIGNLNVGSNATMVGWFPGLRLNVSGNATISGMLSVAGSSGGLGAGTASTFGSSGGGHGGFGGRSAGGASGGTAFDSVSMPSSWGGTGGGTPSVPGGGYLQLTVANRLTVDGAIFANGLNGPTNCGGGAGGGILLSVGGLSGSGVIAADGGGGFLSANGGGGGGRIALYYTSNTFSGTLSAKGGAGFASGGAGTIFLKAFNAQLGRLLVDNGGTVPGTNTLWDSSASSLSDVTINSGSVTSTLSFISLNSLNLGPNASLLVGQNVNMIVSSNATIASGAALSADGANTSSSLGMGLASPSGSGGGAHAGYGGSGFGAAGGNAQQGSAFFPNTQGGRGGSTSGTSGLGGGAGGGAIHLTVNGLLNLDGRISANGMNVFSNNSGGGAGGSVWLTANRLTGSGQLAANGGSGHLPAGGGGGGGRIALTVNTSNSFNGTMSAVGGNGFVRGGAGTIYFSEADARGGFPTVLVDNGGSRGTNTAVFPNSAYNLTVQGGGIANNILTPFDLLVRSNGWVSQTGLITVSHNATFEAGGGLTVDGLGNDAQGAGLNSTSAAGGGGHGGYGGQHTSSFGQAYDFVKTPTRAGGKGGNGSGFTSSPPLGGAGGGAVHLNVGSTLRVDGAITAAGLDGDVSSGGGAGGSIWLSALNFTGGGAVSAAGGDGNGSAGGGAGGRVAIYYTMNSFTGAVSACAGNGFEPGGAGTVYLRSNSLSDGQLLVNNCGLSGAATPLSQAFGLAPVLSVGNGGVGEFQGALPVMSNIVVSTGGALTGTAADTNVSLIVLGDMAIQAGGAFALDGIGYAQGAGPGAGISFSSTGGGGGYGGNGGVSSAGAAGGTNYGSASQPVDRGSGGGFGFASPFGGSSGGGALQLSISGQLTIDGVLSANGVDGVQDNSGGGAGGSLWVTARTVVGAGAITASGGTGEPFNGGGGGGGRIAIYTRTNSFTGPILADGGSGATPGGSGSVLVTNIPLPIVVAQSPSNIVSYAVGNVDLTFGSFMNGATADPGDFVLATPDGLVPQNEFTVTALDLNHIRVSFPAEDTVGYYEIHAGPGIEDVFGQSMAGAYIGSFLIFPPTIAGHVNDTNGLPVPFVTLRAGSDLLPVVTDSHGAYSLEVVPGWSGTITPSKGTAAFLPLSRTYVNVGSDMTNENYVLVSAAALTLNAQQQGSSLNLSYIGVQGVNYQMMCSTNLIDWVPYGNPVNGTNALIEMLVPTDAEPLKFFRFKASP